MLRRYGLSLSLILSTLSLLAGGCEVDPYCLTCAEAGMAEDAGRDGGTGFSDAQPQDAQADADTGADACVEDELCNDLDDDCDGMVDEGFDLLTNPDHCGACNDRCAPVHAFGVCVGGCAGDASRACSASSECETGESCDGVCTLGACDVNWYDLDGDPATGCEYRCVGVGGTPASDDILCNLADDDCDGRIDEDVDLLTDEMNCGRCGRTCSLLNASGACVGACDGDPTSPCSSDTDCASGETCEGTCTLDSCDMNYWNLDGRANNGCEYMCEQATPPVETCNANDDDCDGAVDGATVELGGTTCTSDTDCPTGQTCDTGAGTCNPGQCGSTDVGECQYGVWGECRGGRLVCSGNIEPVRETCNGLDDDCDGTPDDSPSDIGRVCSTGAGVCAVGTEICDTGALSCSCGTGFTRIDHPTRGPLCVPTNGPTGTATGYVASIFDGTTMIELCNGFDDDCDGTIDEVPSGTGGACANTVSTGSPAICTPGAVACVDGALRCACPSGFTLSNLGGNEYCAPTGSSLTESCNSLDDNCNGTVDEGNPGGGVACATGVGVCTPGATSCSSSGSLDCICPSGHTTINHPTRGTLCIPTNGPGGSVTGYVSMIWDGSALTELCNNIDDDCDGTIDEMPSDVGAVCANTVGSTSAPAICRAGTTTCVGGSPQCNCPSGYTLGSIGANVACIQTGQSTFEICDTLDNDCDGTVNEDFSLTTDINNCGACGNVCALPHVTVQSCAPVGGVGTCRVGTCEAGWFDRNGVAADGCEYACSGDPSFPEVCNARDDDCDGTVDEGVSRPLGCDGDPRRACTTLTDCSNYCTGNPLVSCTTNADCTTAGGTCAAVLSCEDSTCDNDGVCAAATATCSTSLDVGWVCNYAAITGYVDIETTQCDGLDNDCDGIADEYFTNPANRTALGGFLKGDACSVGDGVCRGTGSYVCNTAGTGIECNATLAAMPANEACDNVDNDCDGDVDEVGPNPLVVSNDFVDVSDLSLVTLPSGVRMMSYEASRPDATGAAAGSASHIACSRAARQPWVDVTWTEAAAACAGLGTGWGLCDAADWQDGCEGPMDNCGWSYSSSCMMSSAMTCNGAEYDCLPGTAGDQDCRYPTGSSTFPMCYTDWGGGARLYDMSGNVREWTSTSRGSSLYEVRGGSYNHIEAGRTCQWDFTVSNSSFSSPNTGFRCCLY